MKNIDISRLKNNNKIMIHSADPKLTINHITFWINTLTKIDKSFSILVRDLKSYNQLTKDFPQLQICYAKNPIDVETVINVQSNLKTVFYTTNLAKNIHLLRFNYLKHIFIGTKNSEWLNQFNKSYRAYDEIWCGGEFVINRIKEEIKNIAHLKFKIVGKPHLKEIFDKNYIKEKSFLLLIDNNDSLSQKIYYIIHKLNQKYYIYNSNKQLNKDLLNITQSHGLLNKITIFNSKELINEFAIRASYIITDLKNLNPYLLSYNIPIIVYIEKEIYKYTIEPILLQDILYYFSDKNELLEILKNLNKENDFLKEKRENISNQFFNKEATIKESFIKELTKEI